METEFKVIIEIISIENIDILTTSDATLEEEDMETEFNGRIVEQ